MRVLLLLVLFCLQAELFAQRFVSNLHDSWNFIIDAEKTGIQENWPVKGLPQNNVQVNIPHTWNVMPGNETYWGTAWYERSLNIPTEFKGKTIRLQFNGVYHDAVVWVNGKKAGSHTGLGYTPFVIDISAFVKAGKTNRLVVLVDNSASRNSLPFMKSFDWAHDGGIYRPVSLIVTDQVFVERVDITAIPELPANGKGIVNLKITAPTLSAISKPCSIVAEVKEENQLTSNVIHTEVLKINNTGANEVSLNVGNCKLWHFDRPNLYKLTLKLIINGKLSDTYSATFGFRTFAVDGDRFVLNGEKVRLAGTEWMPGSSLSSGMAESPEQLSAWLKLLKETNCIYTRFHWPQDEFVLDWCDRNGILVQEEIPYWGGSTEMNDTTVSLGKQLIDEMLAAHFNHPSIITWGIGNELQAHNQSVINALTNLREKVKKSDPSRLVTYVSNSLSWSLAADKTLLPDATNMGDVMMWNEYTPTWYEQLPENTLPVLQQIHAEYPAKPLVISEFGLCEPVFPGGDTRRIADVSFQMPLYGSLPFITGSIYFCLNDYRTHMGEDFTYNYPQRVHGLVDIKMHPKPSYEVVKTLCSPLVLKHLDKSADKWTIELMASYGLPSYTVEGYTITGGKTNYTIPTLKPGEKIKFSIIVPENCNELKVIRPTGFEVLKLH